MTGANTAGVIDPVEAAELASRSNVTIYTVGVGAEEMQQRSFFSTRTVNPLSGFGRENAG